jgi:hypothetical protein
VQVADPLLSETGPPVPEPVGLVNVSDAFVELDDDCWLIVIVLVAVSIAVIVAPTEKPLNPPGPPGPTAVSAIPTASAFAAPLGTTTAVIEEVAVAPVTLAPPQGKTRPLLENVTVPVGVPDAAVTDAVSVAVAGNVIGDAPGNVNVVVVACCLIVTEGA